MLIRSWMFVAAAAGFAANAEAATFDFTYYVLPSQGADQIEATGLVEATDQGGFYSVDDVSGSRDGASITGYDYFDPTPQSFSYSNGQASNVDFSYYIGATNYEVRYPGSGYGSEFADGSSSVLVTSFALAPHASTSAVPEPASWTLMVGGFGLLGGVLRQARRKPEQELADRRRQTTGG